METHCVRDLLGVFLSMVPNVIIGGRTMKNPREKTNIN
jgi:hypothetical protein